ncbi:MAG: UDP-N-acetylmuramate--L-alanine ligase [Candidatus Eisenbacteria bacterium]
MFGRVKRIHLVGIGGTGMSGIAEILINLGLEVTGSDTKLTEVTDRLVSLGAEIAEGHGGRLVAAADVAVVSSAIGAANPEIRLAHKSGVPVIPRAEMLAELMRLKRGIAIGGAHGKTTTTWLTALVLAEAGFDPTIVVGGRLKTLGTNARLGRGDLLVAEADESDGTFLMLTPTVAVVTNIDREHLDFYEDFDAIKDAFLRFMNRVPFFGVAVANADDEALRELLPRVTRRVTTFGIDREADLRAEEVKVRGRTTRFSVRAFGGLLGEAELHVPGLYNVRNALAAVAVGLEVGAPFEKIAAGIAAFEGIHRRLEIKGERSGRTVIDDYGHHPTEIRATLQAIRQAYPERRVVVLFQPHRYTRTSKLLGEFSTAFEGADRLFLLDIYPASETPIPGVDSGLLAKAIREAGGDDPEWIRERSDAAERVAAESAEGDVIVTLGAGDVSRSGEAILEAIGRREGGGGRG